jgi:hypothetical protein
MSDNQELGAISWFRLGISLTDGQTRHFTVQPDSATNRLAGADIFFGKSRHQHFAEGGGLVIVDDVNAADLCLYAVEVRCVNITDLKILREPSE